MASGHPQLRLRLTTLLLLVSALVGILAVPGPHAGAATVTPVMGGPVVSAADLAGWFRSTGKTSGSTMPIDELAILFIQEGAAEGVAGDLAFAQSIVETGYFGFSSRVPGSFNNFSGLGAVDGGTGAARFATARLGVRAQIQHLRAYADPTVTVARLANPLIDPRFHLVLPKGRAPRWEQFGNGIWATDPTYASKVLRVHGQIVAWAGTSGTWAPFRSSAELVSYAYTGLLARPATSAELGSAVGALEGGTVSPPEQLAAMVDGEGAAHAQPVARLYLAALGRFPDRGGLHYWTRRHRDGVRLGRLAEQFLTSTEFERRYGRPDAQTYVDLLYVNVLGRTADDAGADYWVRRLVAGQIARPQLLVQFSQSPEHIRDSRTRVEASIVYLGLLQRPPDPSVLSWWSTRRSTGSELVVLTGLVLDSAELRSRLGR